MNNTISCEVPQNGPNAETILDVNPPTAEHHRPKTGDVVIWDVEPEPTSSRYWVRLQGRGSATHLFEGPDAWARARAAAEDLAGPEGTIWQRHKDGRFERLSGVNPPTISPDAN